MFRWVFGLTVIFWIAVAIIFAWMAQTAFLLGALFVVYGSMGQPGIALAAVAVILVFAGIIILLMRAQDGFARFIGKSISLFTIAPLVAAVILPLLIVSTNTVRTLLLPIEARDRSIPKFARNAEIVVLNGASAYVHPRYSSIDGSFSVEPLIASGAAREVYLAKGETFPWQPTTQYRGTEAVPCEMEGSVASPKYPCVKKKDALSLPGMRLPKTALYINFIPNMGVRSGADPYSEIIFMNVVDGEIVNEETWMRVSHPNIIRMRTRYGAKFGHLNKRLYDAKRN